MMKPESPERRWDARGLRLSVVVFGQLVSVMPQLNLRPECSEVPVFVDQELEDFVESRRPSIDDIVQRTLDAKTKAVGSSAASRDIVVGYHSVAHPLSQPG